MAATPELNPFLFSISHIQSIESLPKVSIDVFTMAPYNWSCISLSKLPSTSLTTLLPPSLSLCSSATPEVLLAFTLRDSTSILRWSQQHPQTPLCCQLLGLSPVQTKVSAYFWQTFNRYLVHASTEETVSISTFLLHSTCCYHLFVIHCLDPALWSDNFHSECFLW